MKRWFVCLCAAALLLLFAAGIAQATSLVEGVSLPDALKSVDVGATVALAPVVTPEGAVPVSVKWTSSRTQYATVKKLSDGSWVLTGKRMGRTILTVWADGKKDSRLIYVTAPQASGIRLNRTSLTLNPAGHAYSTYRLVATTKPSYHSDSIEWTTDDTAGAVISLTPTGNTCLVTTLSDGTEEKAATVTATAVKSGKTAVCVVTVKKIPEKYVRMATSVVVPRFSERPLTATVYPTDAFDRSITSWTVVKNPEVVEIQPLSATACTLVAKNPGTAILEARTAGNRTARCRVTVKLVRYSKFSASPSSKVLENGTSFDITTKISPTYVSYPDVTFESSNIDAATVTSAGRVTGVGRGYATITVKADNGRVKRYISVRVIDNSQSVEVTVSAIGDVMLGGDPRKKSFKRFETLWAKGSDYFFGEIRSQLKGVAFANLEIPLYNTSRVAQGSRSYIFRGKTAYAQALKDGGIDAVDLDNNHIMDYGYAGYRSTRSAVGKLNIGAFGRSSVVYKIEKGVKIGFAGYRPENISIARLKANIRAIQKRCDIVVVSFHWGSDFRYTRAASQVAYGRAAIAAGADLVVGHHSHVVSGIELYKNRYIVYGLGTIVSTVELPKDIDTFIYQHTFSVLGTTVSNAGGKIVPVKMSQNTSYNDAQPVLATGSAKSGILEKIAKYSPGGNLPSGVSG